MKFNLWNRFVILSICTIYIGCTDTSKTTSFKDIAQTPKNEMRTIISGACGSSNNICSSGTLIDVADSPTHYLWSCNGNGGGANAACNLAINTPQVGICGLTENTCLSGSLVDTEDTEVEILWFCQGLNSGASIECRLPVESEKPQLANCIQVFYDDDGGFGRTSALMLLNLLGHFPEYQQVIGPIESYEGGDIERCEATFYLGTEYDNELPNNFLEDFKNADMPVVWMGYNFWKLGEHFNEVFGFQNYSFDSIDYTNLDSDGMPSFFKNVNYKGETFFKYNVWDSENPETVIAPDEMTILRNQIHSDVEIMAEAEHSFTHEIVPWTIRARGRNVNKFFVAEVPFSHIHEADRYLVLADLLFDFLQQSPRHNAKYAVVRLDEIHPFYDRNILQEAISILHDHDIQPTISLIPHFADPLYGVSGHMGVPLIRMEEDADFTADIERYISEGGVVLWNGVTHQYGETQNPYSAISGDDLEFWNSVTDSPLAEDSVWYVLDRLDDGFISLKLSGIEPQVWVTPNDQASSLDNLIFGQTFGWLLGRGFYFDFVATNFNLAESSISLAYKPEDPQDAQNNKNRRNHFSSLAVTTTGEHFNQFYPYEIYGDIYFSRVIPENLGNVQPFVTDQVSEIQTVDTILANAKRNLVLRDIWASLFYHPFLLDPDINPVNASKPKDLEKLVMGIKALGYEFINVNDFASEHITEVKPKLEINETR